ncbi:MAG: hypothetical protein BM557_10580 [Flavobacterium sp. MedPE-SWcel]|uniref:hypothetical protein n=1 Tax=uncultured Flavobacterium sp. TaxID=165435 RepID=UPI00091F8CFD|nr:hypothetical protein [uncultured Flavobacterium sp.]OIQ15993.1 MAG: hypothetical protein BM557_10580 [Flavobacterium sp. MedPE-SWcel]
MSHKKKGQLTLDIEWRKHLRKFGKRVFWKGERKAEKKMIPDEIDLTGIFTIFLEDKKLVLLFLRVQIFLWV